MEAEVVFTGYTNCASYRLFNTPIVNYCQKKLSTLYPNYFNLVPSSLYEQHYFGDSDAHFPVFAECSDLKNKEAQKNKNSSSQRTN